MKRAIYSWLAILLIIFNIACNKNFLDKAPGTDVTEDNVFSNKTSFDNFLATAYRYGLHSCFRYFDDPRLSTIYTISEWSVSHPTSDMCDEGEKEGGGQIAWNSGNIRADNIVQVEDLRYYIRWTSLRQIATILEKVDEVPDITEEYKKRAKAEVRILRAMNYFEMVKRYGGVPIVTEKFEPGVPLNKPRNTLKECFDFIISECDAAFPDLEPRYPVTETGRITSVTALSLKAKTLLYAASPIFNTAQPVISMNDPANNNLICFGNYDKSRWKLAADACKMALDYALENGYNLIDLVADRDPNDVVGSGLPGPGGNYRNTYELSNNPEIIFAFQGQPTAYYNYPLQGIWPACYGGWTDGISMPLNFIKKYEKKDGTKQTWDDAGGDDLLAKYAELDPRFKQSVIFTNSYFCSSYPIASIWNGGDDYYRCKGGVWIRKYISRQSRNQTRVMIDPLFRVNELYLHYAEALNEFYDVPPAEAYDAVNKIRARSKMPNLPQGMTQQEFRERLRNEKAIELFFDDQRFWDIRRWLIAEQDGIMNGDFQGLQINKVSNTKFTWKPYVFETRTFLKKMYIHPFPENEVLKGNLIQNPGY